MFTPVQMSRAESIIEREPIIKHLFAEKHWYRMLRKIPGCGRKIAVAVIAIALRDNIIGPDDPELRCHLNEEEMSSALSLKGEPYLGSIGLKFRYRALDIGASGKALSEADIISTTELAEQLSINSYGLNYHRRFGKGPPFSKKASRVHYRLADVQNWLSERGKIRSF